MDMYNIAVINLWPTPYKDPIYKKFYEMYSDGYNLYVFYLKTKDLGHQYQKIEVGNYKSIVVGGDNNTNFRSISFWRSRNKFKEYFKEKLIELKINCIIIPGHGNSLCQAVLDLSRDMKIPYVYTADTISNDTGSFFRKTIRSILTKKYLSRAGAVWVPGVASRRYVHSFNIPQAKVFEGSYCIDTDTLSMIASEKYKERDKLRAFYGFRENEIVLLFAGRFLKVCNFDMMIRAFLASQKDFPSIKLVIVGGGDEAQTISKLIADNKDANTVIMDFIPIDEIVSLYVAADIYYMTYDWAHYSLACFQAALCKKPIISTSTLGAAFDCIENNINGIIIPPRDIDAATKAINKLAGMGKNKLEAMGTKSYDLVKYRTLTWAAQQMKMAIDVSIRKN